MPWFLRFAPLGVKPPFKPGRRDDGKLVPWCHGTPPHYKWRVKKQQENIANQPGTLQKMTFFFLLVSRYSMIFPFIPRIGQLTTKSDSSRRNALITHIPRLDGSMRKLAPNCMHHQRKVNYHTNEATRYQKTKGLKYPSKIDLGQVGDVESHGSNAWLKNLPDSIRFIN